MSQKISPQDGQIYLDNRVQVFPAGTGPGRDLKTVQGILEEPRQGGWIMVETQFTFFLSAPEPLLQPL
jgi:hypothetical protein